MKKYASALILCIFVLAACSTGSSPSPTATTNPLQPTKSSAIASPTSAATKVATVETPEATATSPPTGTATGSTATTIAAPATSPVGTAVPTVAPTVTFAPSPAVGGTATVAPAVGTGTPLPSLVIPPNKQLAQIVRFDEQIRGLELKQPIPDSFLTRKELGKRIESQVKNGYSKKQADADQRVLEAFGLIPKGLNLRKLQVNLNTEQIAGFYDPDTNKMYVISDKKKLDALSKVTYSHEVVHALQDQHFDLTKVQKEADKKNDDASLATTALIEGDASEVQYAYIYAHSDLIPEMQKEVQQQTGGSQVLDKSPPFISQTLLFPYQQGQQFVDFLVNKANGRWTLVNEAYKHPPESTEQIMHPQKYLDHEAPIQIKLSDLSSVLGKGWSNPETNLFGEFQTLILLNGQLPDQEAQQAAAGWGGDEFALWENGGKNVVIWKTAWDTEDDSNQFYAALRKYDQARFNKQYEDQNGTLTMSADGQVYQIRKSGKDVYYVVAPDQETAGKVMDAFGK